jgi:hypothetical protein
MKSLIRMSSASVLQAWRLYNGRLVLSLTPGFSPVHIAPRGFSRFNGFSRDVRSSKPLKRLIRSIRVLTGLKAGVNEIG